MLGEAATLRSVPPAFEDDPQKVVDGYLSLDWEGESRCSGSSNGSFESDLISAKVGI